VRDAIEFEKRGIPSVVLVTEPFLPAARGQAKTLGMADLAIVTVRHPLAYVDEAGIAERAESALGAVARALTS
jgi:hypothetical protein